MHPTSLDKQSGAADDDHIVRIVRLETQMDNVAGALLALQRTQEMHHQAMLAGFESLRNKIDDVQRYLIDRQDRAEERLDKRIDRLVYWMAGLTITNLLTMIGLILRVAGAI
ncbi:MULTISPECIES: hypothetical protein [unclassified Duganella]|uniref:hypothetical protein n=1 Tax=unclassified Duganella TaxID=2636909 RepID=UPI0008838252|nr:MULTISPECIES: hypothetical protein [unclassified Duganella]SDG91081.1 hypothetical protein SAMN05216320_10874 [Duganella sp. OV458]SDJ51302.1 hypothetical protein SAMN05428973_104373 [Duganella sp. OV510]